MCLNKQACSFFSVVKWCSEVFTCISYSLVLGRVSTGGLYVVCCLIAIGNWYASGFCILWFLSELSWFEWLALDVVVFSCVLCLFVMYCFHEYICLRKEKSAVFGRLYCFVCVSVDECMLISCLSSCVRCVCVWERQLQRFLLLF